jgi:hypothetical protein
VFEYCILNHSYFSLITLVSKKWASICQNNSFWKKISISFEDINLSIKLIQDSTTRIEDKCILLVRYKNDLKNWKLVATEEELDKISKSYPQWLTEDTFFVTYCDGRWNEPSFTIYWMNKGIATEQKMFSYEGIMGHKRALLASGARQVSINSKLYSK